MSPAAAAPPAPAAPRSLPPLGGGLLFAYRLTWALLAIGALAAMISLTLKANMDPLILSLRLAKVVVLAAVSIILLRRRKDDAVAALLSLALLLWTITSSFDLATGEPPLAVVLADRLRFLLFAFALLLFPAGRWSGGWTQVAAAACLAVFVIGVAEAAGLLTTRFFLPLAVVCVIASLLALLARFRGAGTAERQQLKWIALGLTAGVTLIVSARVGAALPQAAGPYALRIIEAMYQLGIVVLALGFLVSLIRYRLYDAEAVISRSAAYAALTLCLVATFAGTEAAIEMLGQRYFGSGFGNVSGAMAAAVAAVLLAPLHGWITGWAERRFQRDLVDLKQRLPELLTELSASASVARVGIAVLPRIGEALHADRLVLLFDGQVIAATGIGQAEARKWTKTWQQPVTKGEFHSDGASRFPLAMALRCPFGSLRGWLLIGPRPDGSLFARDEVDALSEIASPFRRALFAAREREMERARDLARRRGDLREMRQLGERLAALEGKLAGQAAAEAA